MARAPHPHPPARIGGFSRPSGVRAAASQRCVRGAQAPYKAETLGRWEQASRGHTGPREGRTREERGRAGNFPPSSLPGAPHPLQTLPFKASLHKRCQALLLKHNSILPLIHFINPTALRVKSLFFSLVHEALLEGSHLLPSFPPLSS